MKLFIPFAIAISAFAQGDFPPCQPGSCFLYVQINQYCQPSLSCSDPNEPGWYECQYDYVTIDGYYGTTCDTEHLGPYCVNTNGFNLMPKNPLVPDISPQAIPALFRLPSHPGIYQRVYQAWDRSRVIDLNAKRFWWRSRSKGTDKPNRKKAAA